MRFERRILGCPSRVFVVLDFEEVAARRLARLGRRFEVLSSTPKIFYPAWMLSFERKAADGGGSRELFVVGIVIAAVSLALAIAAASLAAKMSEHVPHRKGDDGPLAQTGVLVAAPDESRSALGDDASAWVGAVGAWDVRQGKKGFVPFCTIGRAYGVSISLRDGLSLRLAFARPGDSISSYLGSSSAGTVGLDLGPLSGEGAGRVREVSGSGTPELVKSHCGEALAKLGADAVYRERVIKADAEVAVFGCKRGYDLVPCGDGLDMVSVKSLDTTRSALRGEMPYLVALLAVASLFALSAIGARALSLVSRTRRTWR